MLSKSEVARLRGLSRKKRERREAGRFVVEGIKLVEEVLASDLPVVQVVSADDWELPWAIRNGVYSSASACEMVTVARHELERIASTASPQPVLAEVELPSWDWEILEVAGSVVVAADLNDPGNVGTLARSAESAGFDALVALGATADPWGPKTVRAAAGALFRLPVVEAADIAEGLRQLASLGFTRVGTRMDDAAPCDEIDLAGRTALVLGSEAHGLGEEHSEAIDLWTSIPMAGPTESLNVAMAGTILTYEVGRQRRAGDG